MPPGNTTQGIARSMWQVLSLELAQCTKQWPTATESAAGA